MLKVQELLGEQGELPTLYKMTTLCPDQSLRTTGRPQCPDPDLQP